MSEGFVPKYYFQFIPKANQTNVQLRFPISNAPKYVDIYNNMCSCDDDMKEDRAPWASSLISTIIDFCNIHIASLLAKKNVQMQVKTNYYSDGFVIAMIIPN